MEQSMGWKRLSALELAGGSIFAADSGLHVTEAEAKRAAIAKPAPEYPMAARQLKVVGKVSLEAVIAEDGHVSEVRIVSGNPILTRPAAEALRKWRFKPFESGGKAAGAVAPITFEFDTH
jgi:TonB family protein